MPSLPSTRPYLIRAMHEWCMDHGFTPYLSVAVDGTVRVPRQHVVDGEIVLNISTDATSALVIGNDYIDFKARFGGVPQDISVPVARVQAIYARENGQGMAFPVESVADASDGADDPFAQASEAVDATRGLALVDRASAASPVSADDTPEPTPPAGAAPKSRPALKRVK